MFTGDEITSDHLFAILSHWENGIWNNGLLVFAYQMMLILVLGHVLVLSKPVEQLILRITSLVSNSSNAAVLVVLPTMLVSFFNWGLGLIFGAILARKVGEYAKSKDISINYPLIGACGYSGLMVWHGGISGSAPIKVSEAGHLKELLQGISTPGILEKLPGAISTSLTVFSYWNIILFATVALSITVLVYFLGKKSSSTSIELTSYEFNSIKGKEAKGAEKLDYSRGMATLFGVLILLVFLLQ